MYDIKYDASYEKAMYVFSLIFGLGFVVTGIYFGSFAYFFSFLGLIIMLIGIAGLHTVKKQIDAINRLNESGILLKNIPYKLVTLDNGSNIILINEFKLPNGDLIKIGDNENIDGIIRDVGDHVDVVIDPNDYSNYYVNYEVNRIGGNKKEDFYITDEEIKIEKNKKVYKYPKNFTFGNVDIHTKLNNKK